MGIRGIEKEDNALPGPIEIQVEATAKAPAESVYAALADLRAHLDWAGARRPEKRRLLTLEAPDGTARAGTEFSTTGSDMIGTFTDQSVVTEATPGRVFEFVTESTLTPKRGGKPVRWTIVHRYEVAPAPAGTSISYRFRITRISRLMGPLRLLRSPLAFALRKGWASIGRGGLRKLVEFAEA